MSATHGCRTDGYGKSEVISFCQHALLFFQYKCSFTAAFQGRAFGHSIDACHFECFFRRMGDCDIFQFFRRINMGFRIGPSPVEDFQQRLVFFQFDGIEGGERERTQTLSVHHGFYVFRNARRIALFPATYSQVEDSGMEAEHGNLRTIYIRCNSNNQLEFRLGYVFEMIEHFYVCGKCAFQILRTFILYIEQQHRWFPVDKKCDQSVHFSMRNSYFPVIFFS